MEARLIAHNPQTAKLKASGYIGEPTGNIDLFTQGVHNVKPFATATVKLPMEEKTVPADLAGQTITPSENYAGMLQVNVEPARLEEKEVTPSTVQQDITPSEDFDALSKVTVFPTPLVEKTITPSTVQQPIVPKSPAIGFSEVIVEPVTPSIDPDIQPQNIKQGVDILGVQGTLKPPTLITQQITENGTYSAEDDNADGYSEVDVDIDLRAFANYIVNAELNER